MKLSFKIPKGVSESSLQELESTVTRISSNPNVLSITKRMIHIDIGDVQDSIDAECHIETVKSLFETVSDFIEQNTPY
jgi:hypothetical protein